MKRYRHIAAGLIATAFLATGCSDSFLEVTSPTQEFIDTYYTTDAHIQEAVVAAYEVTSWPMTSGLVVRTGQTIKPGI